MTSKRLSMVIVALYISSTGVALQNAQGPCEAPDLLREAGFFDEALTMYVSMLNSSPIPSCALAGIEQLGEASGSIDDYRLVRTLVELGLNNEALEEIKAVIRAQPGVPFPDDIDYRAISLAAEDDAFESVRMLVSLGLRQEALDQLEEAIRENPNALVPPDIDVISIKKGIAEEEFSVVRALARLGELDGASQRLEMVVQEIPGIEVPEDLQYLGGGRIAPWRAVRRSVDPWIRPAGEAIAVLIVAVLLLYAIGWRVTPWYLGSRRRRLDIRVFDDGATGLKIGRGFPKMLEEEILRLGNQGSRDVTRLLEGPVEGFAIPEEIRTAISSVKAISALLEWLYPPNVLTLMGYLQKPGQRGAGVTLSLVNAKTGEILANQSIWQGEYISQLRMANSDDPSPFYDLAEPAAIWILYQLHHNPT